jgi:ribosomal protein S18 acetylase RimI-like enzyme
MTPHAWWRHELSALWVCDLESSSPAPISARRAAIFQELNGAMRQQLSRVMGLTNSHPVLERLNAGRRCFVAVIDDEIASYAWASTGCEHVGELERVFILPEGDFYIWDCATTPDHRGRRLYTALLSHVLSQFQEEGVRRVWIGAARANRYSTRGIINAGFRPAITTHYIRLWRLRYLRLAHHPSAPPALAEDAVRLVAQQDERGIGSIRLGVGEPSAPVCASACQV